VGQVGGRSGLDRQGVGSLGDQRRLQGLIDLTIIEAAGRNGDEALKAALLAERANALPI